MSLFFLSLFFLFLLILIFLIFYFSPYFYANHELTGFLMHLISADDDAAGEDPVSAAEAWARDHLSRGVSLAAMARIAGLSRAAFSRVYVAARKRPPGSWLADLRWSVAHEHLARGSTFAAAARAACWRKGETARRRVRPDG